MGGYRLRATGHLRLYSESLSQSQIKANSTVSEWQRGGEGGGGREGRKREERRRPARGGEGESTTLLGPFYLVLSGIMSIGKFRNFRTLHVSDCWKVVVGKECRGGLEKDNEL